MIKVGIVLMPDSNWLGGANYYSNLIHAATTTSGSQIEFVAITDSNRDISQLEAFKCSDVIKTKLLKRFSFAWFLRQVSTKLFKNDFLLSALLRKYEVDVLAHSGWLRKNSKIPTIGWIPDFQHVHLPNFFTESELKARNKAFLDTCTLCTKVIVSSHDALSDLERFCPEAISKAVVMQFAVPPRRLGKQLVTLDELKSRYGFGTPFFLLPNQFWAHKNHQVVIDAIAILKRRNEHVTVLATGNTNDYRQPMFFETLEQQIKSKNIAGEFKILGMIPKVDLEVLYHHANAILNPSLFEGWSTVVEEAKTLRKTIILSDIPIHKEQKPTDGIYFNPKNAEALADLLSQHNNVENLNDIDNDINSYKLSKANFNDYGNRYRTIVKQVLKPNTTEI